MEFFTWKDSFCIGIKELDQQHQSFLECLNDCHKQVSSDKRARVDANLLKRLSTYAADHFRCEEGMMRHFGYAEMGPQERQHQFFVSQIAELEAAQAKGSATSAQSVLAFMRDWFLEHVLSEDKKFAAYVVKVKDKDVSPPRG